MIFWNLIDIVMFSEKFDELVEGWWRSFFLQKLVIFVGVSIKVSHNDALELILFYLFNMFDHKFGEGFTFGCKVFALIGVNIDNFKFFVRQKEVEGNKSSIFSVY